jgi:hypothetical protein
MASRVKSHFWRICRIALRQVRFCLWSLILAALVALLCLNQLGLPGFVKEPLLRKLRARGIDLQFTRLRWRWDRGIVAENVQFGGTNAWIHPTLTLKEMEVQLNYRALAKLQFQVDALVMREGCLTVLIAQTNAAPRVLSLTDIQTELRLLPGDLWELDHFQARFADGFIQLTGAVTNASAVRQWKFLHPSAALPGTLLRRLNDWADALEHIHFATPPRLILHVRGDALDPRSFTVEGKLNAPQADTPWGTLQSGLAVVQLSPGTGNELSQAEITVRAGNAQTPWAVATNLDLTLHLVALSPETNTVQASLNLSADSVQTKWGAATRARFAGQWLLSFTNPLPLSGQGELKLDALETPWGAAAAVQISGRFSASTNPVPAPDSSWAWWSKLAPFDMACECRLNALKSPQLEAEELSCAAQWRAPEFKATRIAARLYRGNLNAEALLNVPTREVRFSGSSDFDVRGISGLLTGKSRRWLTQYSWDKPPELQADGALILPEWTNRHPDWQAQVKPTVRAQGSLHLENAAFRGVPASTADAHFTYSNEVWRLPDIVILRPEGRLDLDHESDERTRDYSFRIHSTIDLRALRPLLEPAQQRGLDLVGFNQPPEIEGEIWGRWYEPERIGARARVALTNFTFRGQSADGLQTGLTYTNRFLILIEPRLQRAGGAQQIAATGVGADFHENIIHLTNGFSTADPLAVTRAIGPKIARIIEPYRFLQPPTARVNGIIPIRDEGKADLHFDIEGGPFEWWKFKTPRITGRVDWVKRRLTLSDVRADFYGGAGFGGALFNFDPDNGTDFSFNATVTNSNLHVLMADLSAKSNRLEGMLTARLDITHANSTGWRSWQGKGRVSLQDGLIWEIPIFGLFTPVLDSVMPGLGSSRANEGSATFALTNGVISSDDLEIRASMMRLRYWGKLDMQGRVNAQAEAELLRDTWVLGRFLSLALWPVSKMFQYEITGTLSEPKSDPVFFVPRLVLFPLHPIRTLKDLAPESPDQMPTNAPPH